MEYAERCWLLFTLAPVDPSRSFISLADVAYSYQSTTSVASRARISGTENWKKWTIIARSVTSTRLTRVRVVANISLISDNQGHLSRDQRPEHNRSVS